MSEVEKLRALLAEARAAIHLVLDIDALQGWACEAVDDAPPVDDLLRDIRQRIDAALAEPVKGYSEGLPTDEPADAYVNGLWEGMLTAQRERDEARAEVERLRGAKPELPPRPPDGDGLPRYGIRWNGPTAPIAVPMADGYWTPWHLADAAYRRGAEAMREAAARECWALSDEMANVRGMLTEQGTAQNAATRIRALPIPEDK
jgi:hypothetical protein